MESKKAIVSGQNIPQEIKPQKKSTSFFDLTAIYIKPLAANGKLTM